MCKQVQEKKEQVHELIHTCVWCFQLELELLSKPAALKTDKEQLQFEMSHRNANEFRHMVNRFSFVQQDVSYLKNVQKCVHKTDSEVRAKAAQIC